MPKHTHVWIRVENVADATVHLECETCGAAPPAVKRVVRLVVVDRLVKCPYGFTDHKVIMQDGRRKKKHQPMHDCILDSLTPRHRCRDPEGNGASRCPHIEKVIRKRGLRTYDRVPVAHHVRRGVLHSEWPLRLVYAPLDEAGLEWQAVNIHSGQRQRVVLHKRAPHRRSEDGKDLLQQYDRTVFVENGTMVQTHREAVPWRGVPSRDKFQCNCKNCVKEIKPVRNKLQGVNLDDESEKEILEKEPKPLSLKDAPSANPNGIAPVVKKPAAVSDDKPYVPAIHSMWTKDQDGRMAVGPPKVTGRFKSQKDYDAAKKNADREYLEKFRRRSGLKPSPVVVDVDDADVLPVGIGGALSKKLKDNIRKSEEKLVAKVKKKKATKATKPTKAKAKKSKSK